MYDCNQHYELPKFSINLKNKIMKNLNQDSSNFFNEFKLTNEEMTYVRGGGDSSENPDAPIIPNGIPTKL